MNLKQQQQQKFTHTAKNCFSIHIRIRHVHNSARAPKLTCEINEFYFVHEFGI